MIADLGHSFLLTALIIAAVGTVVPLIIARQFSSLGLRFAQINGLFLGSLFLGSLGVLAYAFIVSDFSLKVVTLNSEQAAPLMYRLVALWGNHEGSLLLWVTTLSLYSVFFSFSGRGIATDRDRTRMLSVLSLIVFGFVLFMLVTSNPFISLSIKPHKGLGLNPLLQDPSMTFHPPSLYFGYIGFVVPFAMAIGFLWRGQFKKEHAAWLRIWTLLPWSLLTFGIAAGSLWAYYELGWGGWWSWDPVENASLLPWLTSTALLHGIGSYRRSGALKLWCLFLALLSWLMSMLGTYITRSGIVASVHGFAKDEQRGLYLLIFMGILAFCACLLFCMRAFQMKTKTRLLYPARSGFIALHLYAFLCITVVLIIGTLYPIWGDAAVSELFFNQTLNPIALGFLVLMALVTFVGWQPSPSLWQGLRARLLPLNIALVFIVVFMYQETLEKNLNNIVAIFVVGLSLWVILASLKSWFDKGAPSMMLAHIGFAVCLMGMGVDSLFHREGQMWLAPGESQAFAGYTLVLKSIQQEETPVYLKEVATVDVFNFKGAFVTDLKPEARLYKTRQALVSKTAIAQRYWAHLYLVLGPQLETGQRSLRIFYHPFVMLIWLGGGLMSLAGLLGLMGGIRKRWRRYSVSSNPQT